MPFYESWEGEIHDLRERVLFLEVLSYFLSSTIIRSDFHIDNMYIDITF